MSTAWQRLKSFPHFLYLFPLFFVFHNYVQNRDAVTGADFRSLYTEYLLATAVLFLAGWLLFKSSIKAALFAFGLMFFHFFFGAFHFALKSVSPNFFLAKYVVLLPLSFLVLVLFFLLLKRTQKRFRRFAFYLNSALLVLLLIDLPPFFRSEVKPVPLSLLKRCDSCAKPDVYFIIADGYADSVSLAQAFAFNNNAFLHSLRTRGFHVMTNSRANYNFTQYAVASLFTMNYLGKLDLRNSSKKDIKTCYEAINQNELLGFFKESGYSIKNFSVFNLANQPAKVEYKFVPMGKTLISSQTFLQRLKRDLGYHLVTTLKLKSEIERYAYYTKESNERLLDLLRDETSQKPPEPRFIFTHLEMPHYPYYFDSVGNPRSLQFLTGGNDSNKDAYRQYLQYANSIFLKLVDDILQRSATPPVIVFMGDHGFREFPNNDAANHPFYFMNFASVYLPGKNYDGFYDGISGVNLFRAVMNAAFKQSLPVLKDSSVLVVD